MLPHQVIIVDDASDVDVKNHIVEYIYIKESEVLYYKFEKNSGACAARNEGAELSNGDILMFLDDDDTWEPLKIERHTKIMTDKPDVGLVYTGKRIVSELTRDKIIREIKPKFEGELYPKILYSNLI